MPVLLQSVARQVGLWGSNDRTPCSIMRRMASLLDLKAVLRASSQYHFPGFKRSLNGCIVSDELMLYATWFTRPNQDLASVMFCGLGKSFIASSRWVEALNQSK